MPSALGCDAPVTGLDPWAAVRATAARGTPGSAVSTRAVFAPGNPVRRWSTDPPSSTPSLPGLGPAATGARRGLTVAWGAVSYG
ncbi:amidohydrolase [Mycobacterium xenopi RIVM700367]|nr:amidohydrolase [Mycobacterium xenopi RIVM700367]